MLHMSDESKKYELLRQVAERATQKQPDEIHLIPAPNHQWTNPAVIEPYTTALHARGMLHAIRSIFKSLFRKGNDLDIMFVADSEVARIEAVCKPFFQCLSSP